MSNGKYVFLKGYWSPMEVKSKFTQRSTSGLNSLSIISNSGPIRRKKYLCLLNLNITMSYRCDTNTEDPNMILGGFS